MNRMTQSLACKLIVLLAAVLVCGGCNSAAMRRAGAPAHTSANASNPHGMPFSQSVPNSSAMFLMIPVPGGIARVRVGASGGGVHEITVADLWFGQTEVTWDAYDVFLMRLDLPPEKRGTAEADPGPDAVTRPTPPYAPPDRGWGHANFPAIGMTFHAAQAYCQWLSNKTGRKYRLPTVAEWQHACRAGEISGIPLDQQAWFEADSDEQTHRVASKRPDRQGLYDMLGNAGEWCVDESGKGVLCGGSF